MPGRVRFGIEQGGGGRTRVQRGTPIAPSSRISHWRDSGATRRVPISPLSA
jgi:hypothetical protein